MKKYIILILSLGCWVGVHAQTPQKITYTYDALNRLTVVTYPNGSSITYNYDVLGNRTSVINAPPCTTPVAPTVVSGNRCGAGTVTLTASGCTGGTISWFSVATGGTAVSTGGSFTTPSLSATANYYAECKVSTCISSRALATATIKAIPTTPSLSANPATVSIGVSSTLSASACAGTVTWSNGITGTSKTVSPTTSTTYTATCTVNACMSTNGSVTVTFNPCPTSLTHSGAIAAHPYKAAQTISSTGNAANGVSYQAGKAILLNPGFSAGGNEVFTAKIVGCN